MRWRRPPALSVCERMCASCFFCKPPLQDDARGRRVDIRLCDSPLATTRLARRLEPRPGLERRVTLVDQPNRQAVALGELAREAARRDRRCALGTVDIIREAD